MAYGCFDLVSSLAGVTGKVITGATGELVLWQGLPEWPPA
jgi:hypothetical protein